EGGFGPGGVRGGNERRGLEPPSRSLAFEHPATTDEQLDATIEFELGFFRQSLKFLLRRLRRLSLVAEHDDTDRILTASGKQPRFFGECFGKQIIAFGRRQVFRTLEQFEPHTLFRVESLAHDLMLLIPLRQPKRASRALPARGRE